MNKGQPRSPEQWGTLRAWAWGASRALDYLETDKAVDARQVGIMGHSRFGKTALVAMAYDPRFAVAYISSAGTGGDKLYRHVMGEQLENLAAAPTFYYWMAGNFMKYAGPLTTGELPVDAHELIALCAPRPVFIGVGSTTAGDEWADPMGEFLGAVGAGPVYRLLGKKDLGTTTVSADGDGAVGGRSGVPAASVRAYAGAELAVLPGVCGAVYARGRGSSAVGYSCFDILMPWSSTPGASWRVVRNSSTIPDST